MGRRAPSPTPCSSSPCGGGYTLFQAAQKIAHNIIIFLPRKVYFVPTAASQAREDKDEDAEAPPPWIHGVPSCTAFRMTRGPLAFCYSMHLDLGRLEQARITIFVC